MQIVSCIVLLHRAVHSLSVRTAAAALLFASFIMLYALLRALILSILASNATDPANHLHQSLHPNQ
jgi:hypothetical protein